MKNLIEQNFLIKNNIKDIKDLSDKYIKRMRIYFTNEFSISIVRGLGTFGNKQDLFEIAIFDKNGEFYDEVNMVEGYLTQEEVVERIKKVITL